MGGEGSDWQDDELFVNSVFFYLFLLTTTDQAARLGVSRSPSVIAVSPNFAKRFKIAKNP
jgi:hypothetical protein